jgi:VanZ family protein
MWILSSIPGSNKPLPFLGFDKIIHIIEYSIFGLLFLRYLSNQFQENSYKKILIFYFIFSMLWAFLDEFHQYFVPLRQMDGLDIIADIIGVIIAYWVVKKIFRS